MNKKILHKKTWFEKGFEILIASGAADLTIQNLTQKLNKTKGSFYHHFKNRDDYSEQLLQFWEEKQTTDIIKLSEKEVSFEGINRQLTKLSHENTDIGIEVAIRAWALRDPLARVFQERVDHARLAFLNQLFALLASDPEKIELIALIRYCFYIGSHQIIPATNKETYKNSLNTLIEMIEIYVAHKGIKIEMGEDQ